MNVIIDTSSLLAFVRNYLPFDKNFVLKNLLKEKFESGELILVDRVYLEARDISNKIISKELEFLMDKSKHKKTTEIFPSQKFFNMLEHQFCNQDVRKLQKITDVEFELAKRKHLETPDCSIILYALQHITDFDFNKPLVVSEETKTKNDGKLFKKIPEFCDLLDIPHCSLPILLKDYFKVDITFKV